MLIITSNSSKSEIVDVLNVDPVFSIIRPENGYRIPKWREKVSVILNITIITCFFFECFIDRVA
ncbi:hypothetical protein GCM10025878_01920 [Leuconostoc gasicomitatum]|nr:hypothetical protein GCM10025878_01920 [Leuconostoc gasicomitatum]